MSQHVLRRQLLPSVRPFLGARTFRTIPQPPGFVVGDVNDPTPVPPVHKLEGLLHWTSERMVAVALVPLASAPFFTGVSSMVDSLLLALLLYHCYCGFQACIIDYIPKRVYGVWHKVAMSLLLCGTGVAGYGAYRIQQQEGGITKIVGKVWNA